MCASASTISPRPGRRAPSRRPAVFLLVLLASWLGACAGDDEAESAPRYHSRVEQSEGVIVFVHGVTGNNEDTWKNPETGISWPDLLRQDDVFEDYDIYLYGYKSPLFKKAFNPNEVAENMQVHFENDGVFDQPEVIFLTHSMGGLVARQYLLKYQPMAPKVSFMYFFATPTEGAEISSLAKLLSDNPQFSRMVPFDSDGYLADQLRDWRAAGFAIKSYCAYEKYETFDHLVVKMRSAAALCTEPLVPVEANHIDIVKPSGPRSTSYLAFRNAFLQTREVQAAVERGEQIETIEKLSSRISKYQIDYERRGADRFAAVRARAELPKAGREMLELVSDETVAAPQWWIEKYRYAAMAYVMSAVMALEDEEDPAAARLAQDYSRRALDALDKAQYSLGLIADGSDQYEYYRTLAAWIVTEDVRDHVGYLTAVALAIQWSLASEDEQAALLTEVGRTWEAIDVDYRSGLITEEPLEEAIGALPS